MEEKIFSSWEKYIEGPEVQNHRSVVGRVLGEDSNYYYDIISDRLWSCITDRKYLLTKHEDHVVLDITVEVTTEELADDYNSDDSTGIGAKFTPAIEKALEECGLELISAKLRVEPFDHCKYFEDSYFIRALAKTNDPDLMKHWETIDENDMQYIVKCLMPEVIKTIDESDGVRAGGVFISTVYTKMHEDIAFNGMLPAQRVLQQLTRLFTKCINYRGGIRRIFNVYDFIVTNEHIGIRFKITPDNAY